MGNSYSADVKRIAEIAVLVPGMFLIPALDLRAAIDAKAAYQIIVDRNPFGLRPPPPPPSLTPPEAPPSQPPATFKLIGITSIQSPKKALILKTESAPNAKPKYLRINEGGRDANVEVLEIDAKGGTVKIEYAGATTILKFENENVKAAAMGAPGGPPYAGMPGGVPPPPVFGGNPTATYPNTAYPTGAAPVPGLSPRFTGAQPPPAAYNSSTPGGAIPPPSGVDPRFNLQIPTPGSTEPVRATPARTLRISPGGTPQSSSPPTPEPTDPAVQATMMELNRLVTQPQVDRGELPPLPPTDFPTGPQ